MARIKSMAKYIFFTLLIEFLQFIYVKPDAIQITKENYQETLNNNKVVFMNFYADWCMFSQQLTPIFHQAADVIHQEFPNVKFGRVDCEVEQEIALQNSVSKYPTIKLFRNGKVLRKEYRGQRSVDAFKAYIKQQLKPGVSDVMDPAQMQINPERNTFIGYFDVKNNEAYKTFERLAEDVFETVDCYAGLGEGFSKERAIGENIVYRPKRSSGEQESAYTGSLTNFEVMQQWLNDKANPLVREITFENGEELTEEGLPFLILFHRPDDVQAVTRYKNAVMRELLSERGSINFLTADGTTFSHPLHHLGKSVNDLPLICIDSFRHMYLFKKFDNVDIEGKLKQFVADLHSGKLHTDFHNPPPETEEHVQEIPQVETEKAPVTEAPKAPVEVADGVTREPVPAEISEKVKKLKPPETDQQAENNADASSPPETIFQKLAPSENRYTLLHWRDYSGNYRDEL